MAIRYFSQKRSFRIPQPKKTSSWLEAVARKDKGTISNIQFVFCTDKYLLKLNRRFLNHDTLTDIITFDYSTSNAFEAEIYISVERVRANAAAFHNDFHVELRRVIVHGLLHLIGYSDKTAAQKAQMRKKEEACLSLWP